MRKIQVKRGREATIPTLAQGELGWTTDEKQLYVGTDAANIPVAMGDHTHTAAQVGADAAGAAQAVRDSLSAHVGNKSNPHGVTAAQVGAHPATWMPTAVDVGAVPVSRTINGLPLTSNITLDAAKVSARPATWTPTAADVGARPASWMPTAAQVGAIPMVSGAAGKLLGYTAATTLGPVDPPAGGGKRTCRFVVGTSTAGWTADDCDYLCDGTADDVEINAAIQALPSTGGEVVILDGTYNITAKIKVSNNYVALIGNGANTVLKRIFHESSGVVDVSGHLCACKDFRILGEASADYVNEENIYCHGDYFTVCGMHLEGARSSGISNWMGQYMIAYGNHIRDCGTGITVERAHAIVFGNTVDCYRGNSGVRFIDSKGEYHEILVCANCIHNASYGISLSYAEAGLVTGNNISMWTEGGQYGVEFWRSTHCLVSNNVIRTPGGSNGGIYTDEGSKYNLIVGNLLLGKNYVNNGANNTFANNVYY